MQPWLKKQDHVTLVSLKDPVPPRTVSTRGMDAVPLPSLPDFPAVCPRRTHRGVSHIHRVLIPLCETQRCPRILGLSCFSRVLVPAPTHLLGEAFLSPKGIAPVFRREWLGTGIEHSVRLRPQPCRPGFPSLGQGGHAVLTAGHEPDKSWRACGPEGSWAGTGQISRRETLLPPASLPRRESGPRGRKRPAFLPWRNTRGARAAGFRAQC